MSKELNIVKVADSEYRVSGSIEVWKYVSKSVTVEGEVYTKTNYEAAEVDFDEDWNNRDVNNVFGWYYYETDFMYIFSKPEIRMWTKRGDHKPLHCFIFDGYIRSENGYVNYVQLLNRLDVFPVKLYAGKGREAYYRRHDWKSNNRFEVVLHGYGFNNFIACSLSYAELLKYNVPTGLLKIEDCIKESLFHREASKLSEAEKIEAIGHYINGLNVDFI